MAIEHHNHNVQSDGKREMTKGQFSEWLTGFDTDKDGRISRYELREAVRANKGWFSTWKSNRGVKNADLNGDGFIDPREFTPLVEFAQKLLGYDSQKERLTHAITNIFHLQEMKAKCELENIWSGNLKQLNLEATIKL
ncbi:calcium-binding protein CML37-like [Actinidia eriantha]|uniref:calcium-binding protein CML37-like n=1 Tax=Actinidia eriantha TaxID=165200 RepID=UPI002582BB0E|nr:calcium-binding protein CML37-like [Actinidia eriantha]